MEEQQAQKLLFDPISINDLSIKINSIIKGDTLAIMPNAVITIPLVST
jgi:hypothetical protein